MKEKVLNSLTIVTASVNYIIIDYALSNMALFFRGNLLYILFFASEVWVTGRYWDNMLGETKSKAVAGLLLACSFVLHVGMVYFTGYISGTLVPFT